MKTLKNNDTHHLLPVTMTKKELFEQFQQFFNINETASHSENFSLLDSFEWGLYFNGYIAFRQGKQINLWRQNDCLDPELSISIDNVALKSKFWWQFFETEQDSQYIISQMNLPVKSGLKKIFKLRALVPKYSGIIKTQQFDLQNDDGKILVSCQIVSIHSSDNPRTPIIRQAKLIPVFGYENDHKAAIKLLNELGAFKPKLPPMETLVNALGITPYPFTVKPNLSISKKMPSRSAISSIVSTMIEKQRMTEFGVIKDIDTEFLHHFRVSLRMIRAAIAQLKVVFPPQDVLMLKDRFGTLARNTNHLRDIDVFLMEKEHYMSLIPASLSDGLIPMFDDFENNRKLEVKRISRWLSSQSYQKEISELESLFKNGYSALETQWSEKPSIELAVNKIQKRYQLIQKSAAKITHDTPDDAIHSIRIDCKKLRYLLYFFGGLFNPKQVKIAGNHLKLLQDKLGIFNDLTVQGEFLENYLNKAEHKRSKDILLIASLGGLIATLHNLQIQERERCIRELAVFSNKENRQLFKQTFVV